MGFNILKLLEWRY